MSDSSVDQAMTGQRGRRKAARLIKNSLLALAAILVVLLVSGLIYQAVGTAADTRNYPPPGQLVSVGDYRLHLYCTGEGSPTVILDTLSGGTSANWGWIQPEIAQTTRVCAYDRAGRGWSDPGVPAADLWTTAENLHTLLQNGAVETPYVLVGHSIAGLYARAFSRQYPDEVAGLVLVDSSHPEQFDRYPTYREQEESFARIAATFPVLARVGLFRFYFTSNGEIDFQDLPARQHAELVAFWSSPAYHQSVGSERVAGPTIFNQAHDLASLGDLPLAVVSAGSSPSSWATLQAELATLSTNSSHLIVEDATHTSLAFNPDHAHQTSTAIVQMVEAARSGR